MGEPIRNRRLNELANAPTPQNTPSTAVSSFAGRGAGSGQPTVSTIREEDDIRAFANNPALLSMIQGKLGSLVGKSSGYIESLPKSVRDRISGLKGIQAEHAKLESQFQEELLALEKKYFAKYEPLYAKRASVIKGDVEPSVEEIVAGKAIEEASAYDDEDEEDNDDEEDAEGVEKSKKKSAIKEAEENEEEDDDDQLVKGIPEFWLTALKNLLPVAETITERDDGALRYLTDIRMKYLDKPGFALVFEFAENPYFTNKTLSKTYYYQEETGYGGDFIYDHAEGDKINWTSPENNLTVRIEKRKQRNKHTKATRTIEKTIPEPSFFSFFSPPKAPSLDGDDEDEQDEQEGDEAAEDIEQQLEIDYQLGEEIREKLIPRAIDWYTGEALQYEDLDEFDEDDLDEDEEEEDEDDDDDDDDDEDNDDVDDDDEGDATGDKPGSQKQPPAECNQS